MSNIADTKKLLRQKFIKRREDMSPESVKVSCDIITEKLLSLEELKSSQNIMLYLDYRNEVIMDGLILKLLSLGKNVYAPISVKADRRLIVAQITNLTSDIRIGAYGIREPKEDCPTVDPKLLDLVIVPGVAFDLENYRMGYGAGYYDRFLEELRPDAHTVSAVYSWQFVDEVPRDEHDKSVDLIVSDIDFFI
ncbi:MAG: 5-formyltetrahydrofolate cyclo-ligase [Clostridioides sp.]|nr:5-formyltetrahydrofolate cyclo-ligase [Clostridioides sp.]